MRSYICHLFVLAALSLQTPAYAPPAAAARVQLYSHASHQSPVRGEPGEILLLPGAGFAATNTIVYTAYDSPDDIAAPPSTLLSALLGESTAERGIAPAVSTANLPHSLTVMLPAVLQSGRSYALWAVDENKQWSNPVAINDARPLWITPAFAYSSVALAGLPRELKVAGRNLQPAPGAVTQVQLTGPQQLTLTVTNDPDASIGLQHYAARVALPARLAPGEYAVSVNRDGRRWVEVPELKFAVRPDPRAPAEFPLSAPANGGCSPNDTTDDRACILRAIAAAGRNGGSVILGTGTWLLSTPGRNANSIAIPAGVNLIGRQGAVIRVDNRTEAAVFTLQGNNRIQDIEFQDAQRYRIDDAPRTLLQLGSMNSTAASIDDIVIAGNVFDKPARAIQDGGLALRRLFIAHNRFGAYRTALDLSGNRFNVHRKFTIEDAVIAYNTFEPGSYLEPPARQGTIASEIGAGRRVDFSHNIADGSATRALQSAQEDARGWRAAFFWHMNGNQELVLVSQNTATCTGDKAGDGEAIAFDGNANTFGFAGVQAVIAADANSVTVQGVLQDKQNNRDIDLDSYYLEHWLQIAAGQGLGQARRIAGYSIDRQRSQVRFTIAPAWDVIPQPGARASIGREYWQVYAVSNTVDHRRPLCLKSNRNGPKGGVIGMWAQSVDSAIDSNRQYDTDGIIFQQGFSAADPACPECTSWTGYQYFLDIRGNLIDGEYDWNSDCSQSGILASRAASPTPRMPPPVVSYGVSIAHNIIKRADGLRGGGIVEALTWHGGPAPQRWPLVVNTLIQHNVLENLDGPTPRPRCDRPQSQRIGVHLEGDSPPHNTVLYANACRQVTRPLLDRGRNTVRVCPPNAPPSCECPAPRPSAQ